MPRHATSTSYGKERGNPQGDQRVAGLASGQIARIREKMRRSVDKRFKVLEDIADGTLTQKRTYERKDGTPGVTEESPDFGVRVRAVETLLRYGVGPMPQAVDVTSGGERILTADERVERLAAIAGAIQARSAEK